MLKEIWDKTTDLLKSEDSIIKAPGFDSVFVKHFSTSETSKIPPHLGTSTRAGKFQCDCKLHKSIKLCEHTVAASDIKGKLKCFIDWRKDKAPANLTNLVMGGVKSGQKGKVNKRRKGGRTPLEKQPATTSCERESLIEGIETESTLNALDEMDQESPFELIYMFQTKAQLCYGCSVKINREKDENSLIVRKHCEREFVQQGVKRARLQYTYFHLKTLCIQQTFPEYKKEVLVISKESSEVVPEEVKTMLRGIGINI